jgi:hypothetical protein
MRTVGITFPTMDYIRERGGVPTLASYDARLMAAADAMGFATVEP